MLTDCVNRPVLETAVFNLSHCPSLSPLFCTWVFTCFRKSECASCAPQRHPPLLKRTALSRFINDMYSVWRYEQGYEQVMSCDIMRYNIMLLKTHFNVICVGVFFCVLSW